MDKNRINIMTSCDDNLTKYIFVQLRTIAMHLRDKEVHFYLFYNRIPEETLEKLEIYCECLGNIIFHRIFIEDIEPYIEFAKNGSGAIRGKESAENKNPRWPYEAYFTFGCQRYLPNDMDRILYIDAGDILFLGGIDEFYFDDFEGNSLIVSSRTFKGDGAEFKFCDLSNEKYLALLKHGVFNSGSYLINLEMYRNDDVSMKELVVISNNLPEHFRAEKLDFTDECLLSVVFMDKIKYFGYKETKEVWYRPYNFTMSFYFDESNDGRELWYDPKIIHFIYGPCKPWKLTTWLLQEKVIEEGQKRTTGELIELATSLKLSDFKFTNVEKTDETLLSIELAPYYEYWLDINNLVQIELSEIFG